MECGNEIYLNGKLVWPGYQVWGDTGLIVIDYHTKVAIL